jgi:hypothetical protein
MEKREAARLLRLVLQPAEHDIPTRKGKSSHRLILVETVWPRDLLLRDSTVFTPPQFNAAK